MSAGYGIFGVFGWVVFTLLENKRILLGITGGIAAYKAAELVRLLTKSAADVQVVMTQSAKSFITPLTMQALSGRKVRDSLLDIEAEAAMGHIELARWADVIVVAPASANFMAELAHGGAKDLLSTLCLASDAPIILCPAMNQLMWANTATQNNIETLLKRHVTMVGPDVGEQACGDNGLGRMSEPTAIYDALAALFDEGLLKGVSVLVTAGPTQEPLDPVRYITNHSSGKMGYALAEALALNGAKVTLVSGPTHLSPPKGTNFVSVITAAEMYEAVISSMLEHDILVATAAVCDYRPSSTSKLKIKKTESQVELSLLQNEDIIFSVAKRFPKAFIVGFAAETNNLKQYALEKLRKKNMDMIVANLVGADGTGFNSDDNEATLFSHNGEKKFIKMPKRRLAQLLVQELAVNYKEKEHAKSTA